MHFLVTKIDYVVVGPNLDTSFSKYVSFFHNRLTGFTIETIDHGTLFQNLKLRFPEETIE